MLFSVTGASATGKSTVLAHLENIAWGVPMRLVEFDSVGVPAGADNAESQRAQAGRRSHGLRSGSRRICHGFGRRA